MRMLNAAVLRCVALSMALVACIAASSSQDVTIPLSPGSTSQAASGGVERVKGATPASTQLTLHGAYTFLLQVDQDGACGWPVTRFYWPVFIKFTSHQGDTVLGSIVFPPVQVSTANTWRISAGQAQTQLVPGQESLGPAGGAYDVGVEGGSWEAGGLTRARDGRGQIISGTASGARQILTLRDSDERWECRSEAKWSLLIRHVDLD